jgi:hypothetical protein
MRFLSTLSCCSGRESFMIYIRIPEKHDAVGFVALAKSGIPVSCLPRNSYGVQPEHLKILKRKKIPFKRTFQRLASTD